MPGDTDDSGGGDVRSRVITLERRFGELRDAIQGKPEWSWPGIGKRVETVETEVSALHRVVDKSIEDERREREAKAAADKRRNVVFTAALSVMGGIITGLVLMLASQFPGIGPP